MKVEIKAFINHHFGLNVKTLQDLYWGMHHGDVSMSEDLDHDQEIKITLEETE